MRRLFLLQILCLSLDGFGQYYFYNDDYYDSDWLWEGGIAAGGMNCFTDLGGGKGPGRHFIKDLNVRNTSFCAGLYFTGVYHQRVGARLEITFGHVKAYDSILRRDNGVARNRYDRNLDFRSPILEIATLLEFFPLPPRLQDNDEKPRVLSPYLLAGFGYYHFNPKAKFHDQWVDLKPLHTEGQGFPEYPQRNNYRLSQINFPMGAGVRYELSAIFNVRLEFLYRFLLTDYLDDVSTRYIEPELFSLHLVPLQGAVAAELADRRRSFNQRSSLPAGAIRGNSANNDGFFSFTCKAGLILNRQKR